MAPGGAEPGGLTGLVLAGGRSRRMGTDKAVLRLDGERLVDRAVRLLGGCCVAVLVASGDGRRLTVAAPQVADEPGVAGPLGGLIAGLDASPTADVAVVAVDGPYPDPAVLALCAALRGTAPVAAPVVDGVVQPLHAVWTRGAVEDLRAAAADGERSPRRLVERLEGRLVTPAEWRPRARDGAAFAVDWDTPDEVPDGLPG
jgi:molybdopterin-guanine dinucleotide biosynthesis protein A